MPALFLYYRQTYSVDFLIDVECIDIRHATDVIQYRHDSLLQILVLYVVLAAYPSLLPLHPESRKSKLVNGC